MIELKVAAKETVRLSFGGEHGWPLKMFILDSDYLARATAHVETISELTKESQGWRDSSYKRLDQVNELKAETENERARLCAMLDQCQESNREKDRVIAEKPVSCIVIGEHEAHLPDCGHFNPTISIAETPSPWKPITTAPKDARSILIWELQRGARVAKWADIANCWRFAGSADEINPTHWMPIPEEPKC